MNASQARAAVRSDIPVPSAEVLQRVASAQTIFVSNASGYLNWQKDGKYCYLALTSVVRQWPGVKVVGTPANADLVFEVSGSEYFYQDQFESYLEISLTLRVIDPKTREELWGATTPVNRGTLTHSISSNFAESLSRVLIPIHPGLPSFKLSSHYPDMYPAQFATMKSLYLEHSSTSIPVYSTSQAAASLYAALQKDGTFLLAKTPADADLILRPVLANPQENATPNGSAQDDKQVMLSVMDPSTGVLLWKEDFPLSAFSLERAQSQTASHIVSFLKSLKKSAEKQSKW